MRYSITFAAATALSSVCIFAAPVENAERGFSIPVQKKANHRANGPKAFENALNKWGLSRAEPTVKHSGLELHPDVAGITERQNSAVTATPDGDGDVEYTCPVQIGTPAQTLFLDFDTGSADLWVFSSEQPASQRAGHDYYTSGASSTFTRTSGTWRISYADGSGASGDVGTDKVVIGGTTVAKQVVELAKTASSTFVSGSNDGLVGLAFGTINTVTPTKAKTFFENAMSTLTNKLFTAYLKHAVPGEYTFGYIDPSTYSGTIKYAPVIKTNGFWEFSSTSYKVGSTTYSQSGTGIADTGTTLLLISNTAASRYYATISGAQYNSQVQAYILPCSSNPPAFQFAIGSNYASVSGANIIYGSSIGTIGSTPYCYGGIQSISGSMYIYGDIFFKQNLGVFDYGNTQFGFAPHAY